MFRLQHIMVQEGDVCPRSDGDDKNPVRTSRHSSKPMQGGRTGKDFLAMTMPGEINATGGAGSFAKVALQHANCDRRRRGEVT